MSLVATQSGPVPRRSASSHQAYVWYTRAQKLVVLLAGAMHVRIPLGKGSTADDARVQNALLQTLCGQALRLAIVRVPPAEAAQFILAEADRQSRATRCPLLQLSPILQH
jgi:hypothetical protein